MPIAAWLRAMLYFLHRLARRLRPWRLFIFVLVAGFALMAAVGLGANAATPDPLLQLGLSGVLWTLMLLATIELFQRLPETPTPRHPFFRRLRLRLTWCFYMVLALIIVFGCLFLLGTSVRLLSV